MVLITIMFMLHYRKRTYHLTLAREHNIIIVRILTVLTIFRMVIKGQAHLDIIYNAVATMGDSFTSDYVAMTSYS